MKRSVSRREFIKDSASYALLCAAAFSFGCSVKEQAPKAEGKDGPKIAIIYATRYGATEDTARWMAKGMDQDVDLLNIATIDTDTVIEQYDAFVIGSGVWLGGVDKRITAFMEKYAQKLDKRLPGTFIVCGTQEESESGEKRIAKYFEQLHAPLKQPPVNHKAFGGRMVVEKLTEEDKKALEKFYRSFLKQELHDWDRTDPNTAYKYGKQLSARIKEGCANS